MYVSAFVPLLLYLFQILVLIALTVLANKRFQRLKHQLPNETSAQQRIKYYSTMNNYLALSLACIFIGLSAVTIDAITTDILFYNKFLLDFFTKIFNFGFCMSFPIALFILVPKVLPYSESMMPLSPLAAPRYKHFTMKDSHLSINATPELPMHPPYADSGRKSPVNVVRDTNGFFRIQ